jgi:hypothetical protein
MADMKIIPEYAEMAKSMLAELDANRGVYGFVSENEKAEALIVAACFAGQAADTAFPVEAAPLSLLRAFLTALVDPMHADLDHLRVDPSAAVADRAPKEADHG